MPEIHKKYLDKLAIEYLDIADEENYKLMLSLKQKYNITDKGCLPYFWMELCWSDMRILDMIWLLD